MTTSQALLILKTEFKEVFFPDEKGNYKSLCQIEDVLMYILNEMTPEVRKFVEAQKNKEIETVETFYKKKIITTKKMKITDMNYKNYTIEPDNTGFATKSMTYGIYKDEESIERCETVEECKKLIDEIILENFEWNDESVIDFVNWYLDLHKLSFRYKLENMEILESFMKGDDFSVWH